MKESLVNVFSHATDTNLSVHVIKDVVKIVCFGDNIFGLVSQVENYPTRLTILI